MNSSSRAITLIAALGCGLLGLAACQRAAPAADAKAPTAEAPAAEASAEGVALTAEQVAKAGIATTPVQPADYAPETSGYGVVVAHDTLAMAVAELATAQAALREGANVVIASSQQARVDKALSTLPGAEGYAVDLTDVAAVQGFFARIGAFDHLVFTAG